MVLLTSSIILGWFLCGLNNLSAPSAPQPGAMPIVKREAYQRYTNLRFGYAVSYPAGVLIPRGESDNSDGQIFRSGDGDAEMRVFGRYNVFDETIKSAFQKAAAGDDANGRVVTYKVVKRDRYIVSGRQNGRIFYEKTMLKGDVFKTFMIEYDETANAKYDPITARVSRSFVSLRVHWR